MENPVFTGLLEALGVMAIIYLIGIKKDSNEEKTKIESIKFCENNIIKFFVISDKNERNIKTFINDLSEQLETRKKNYNQK